MGLYFWLRPLIGSEEVGWICILGASPFAACGFFKFLYPKKLVFKSNSLYYEVMRDAIAKGEKPPRKWKKNTEPQPPAGKEKEIEKWN